MHSHLNSNKGHAFLKDISNPIMKIKYSFIVFFIFFFISGCSSINKIETDNANDSINTADGHDFLTDIFSKLQGQTKSEDETEAVLKSTQLVLQSSSQSNQASVQQQIDEYLEKKPKEIVFDDVWTRLETLYQLSDIQNHRIDLQEKWFTKHKKHIEQTSKRATPFLYFITEEVNKRNMPGEIALLPIIESSFRPKAYSRMKAAGLWQFVPATGTHFGLKQNWWYDGRRDVYHSTLAALTYLQQLNKYYKGDWLLALAAYNAGAGNIDKAIKKNRKKGKPVDYWSLDLPKETFKYIPKLLAVAKIVQNHQELGISLSPIENSPRLMLVDTQSQIELSVVSKMADISLNEMRSYNPAFKQWATDPDGPHHLLIPIDKVERFEKQLALLDDKDRVQWYRHKIRSGESLSVIAHKYKISVSVLKTANRLKNSRIRAGKYLMVPTGNKDLVTHQPVVATISQDVLKNSQTYKVRKGDSFWKIARRFNMSHKKLASLNGLSSGDTLSIGQKLLIAKNKPAKKAKNISSRDSVALKTSEISYKVKSGDSLYTISRHFKVTINDLKRWNHVNLKKYLKPGQELKVIINASSQPI